MLQADVSDDVEDGLDELERQHLEDWISEGCPNREGKTGESRMPEFTLTRKPLTWFKKNPKNRKPDDEQKLRHLGESLRVGQVHPILAQPDGEIIAGHRRFG